MAASLSPEIQRLVDEGLANGRYSSEEDLLREALELLQQRDKEKERRVAALKEKVAVGLAQIDDGNYRFVSREELKAKARAQFADGME